MAAIYQAELWCDDCADLIRAALHADGSVAALEEGGADIDDEHTYDSGEFPKYCSDDSEFDSPKHCASHDDCINCVQLDGVTLGALIGSLTTDGAEYVREAVREGGAIADYWREQFDWIDFGDQCADCGEWAEVNDYDLCDDCEEKYG